MSRNKTKKAKRPLSTKQKIRRIAEDVIMGCLIIIMLFSAWKIYSIVKNYRTEQSKYDEISMQSRSGEFTGEIDFASLWKINKDIIAWIYYEDTQIDYPIVKGQDNDYYLYRMLDGTYSVFGTLFVDAITERPFKQFNTIVYGHHMKNGSMFGNINRLKDPSYVKEHPRMELITPEAKYHLEIWAFLNQPADSNIYTTNISDVVGREAYLETVKQLASYTTDVAVEPTDTLVVLSTCAYEYKDARYMVIGKLVPWDGERVDMNYDAHETIEPEDNIVSEDEEG